MNQGANSSDIIWEDRVRTLRDIVTGGKYPCVVKIKSGNIGKYVARNTVQNTSTGREDEEEILHVLELRRHKMVVSVKLQWDRRTGEYVKTDKSAEINVAQRGLYIALYYSYTSIQRLFKLCVDSNVKTLSKHS